MTEKSNEFEYDSPISSAEGDLLERKEVAENLGKAILSWDGENSIVIGLCGEWGSGKTSVSNLVCEYLRRQEATPAIIEIEPWRWSVERQYIDVFFSALGRALGKDNGRLNLWLRRLKVYSRTLQFPSNIIPLSTLQTWLAGIGIVSVWGASSIFSWSSWVVPVIVVPIFLLAVFSSWTAKVLNEVAELLGVIVGYSDKSVAEQKLELEKHLREQTDFKCVVILEVIPKPV